MKTKILTDREMDYMIRSIRVFIKETSERFNISEEDAIYKIERELRLKKRWER